MKIGIIGAGISGVAAAHFIKKYHPDSQITIFERNERCGGNIRTESHAGFVFEFGPRSFQGKYKDILEMVDDLDLWDKLVTADKQAKNRYVLHRGKLESVPNSFLSMFGNKLLEKPLRTIFKEYKIDPIDIYDSIKTFSYRHFGKKLTNQMIDPFFTGIYAGDISKLSTNAVLPILKEYEREYGSIIKGFIKNRNKNDKSEYSDKVNSFSSHELFSFEEGMETLIEEVIKKHDLNIIYNQQVKMVKQSVDQKAEVYITDSMYKFDKVILTTPSFVSAHLLKSCDNEYYKALGLVKYVPIAVVNLAFETDVVKQQGFGYLIPSHEKQRILGTVFNHKIFPMHSPGNRANISVLLGGANDENIIEKPAHYIVKTAIKHVKNHLNINEEPFIVRIRQYSRAIPQYNMGVEKVWQRLDEVKNKYPSIVLTGNYQYGVGIGDCVKLAKKVAKDLV
jgi:protoporphyrinogen/coproporphyrinogen III oxidase